MHTYTIALFILLSLPLQSFGQSWFHDMPFSPMQTGALFLGTVGLVAGKKLWSSGAEKIAISGEDQMSVSELKRNLNDQSFYLAQLDPHNKSYLEDLRKNCDVFYVPMLSNVSTKIIETKINDNTVLSYQEQMYFLGSKISGANTESRMRILRTVASHAYDKGKSPYKITSWLDSMLTASGFGACCAAGYGLEPKTFKAQVGYFSNTVIPHVEKDIKVYHKAGVSQKRTAVGVGLMSVAAIGGVFAYNKWRR